MYFMFHIYLESIRSNTTKKKYDFLRLLTGLVSFKLLLHELVKQDL